MAPVDLGVSIRGRRVFGAHKTFRGLIAGVVAGAVTFIAQGALARHLPLLSELSLIRLEGPARRTPTPSGDGTARPRWSR